VPKADAQVDTVLTVCGNQSCYILLASKPAFWQPGRSCFQQRAAILLCCKERRQKVSV